MSFKVGKRNCPQTVSELLKEKGVFFAAWLEFLQKISCDESLLFILAYDRKMKNKDLYKKFVDKKAKRPLNIAYADTTAMTEMAEAEDWTNKKWSEHLDNAEADCVENLMSQLPSFLKSKQFGAALMATVKSNLSYVNPKIITGVGMLNNKAFINDKHMTKCVQMTKMAVTLKKFSNVTASGTKTIAEAMFKRQLQKKYDLKLKYADWEKLVDKVM